MKKIIGTIFTFIALAFVISSCGGDTYAKKVDREKKAIKKFLKENDIEVLSEYPASGVFASNQYCKDKKTGVYFNVIDSGKGEKAEKSRPGWSGTIVFMQFEHARLLSDTVDGVTTEGGNAINLQYGRSETYRSSGGSGEFAHYALSPACALPLEHVREGAVVRLLVPFNAGSAFQEQVFEPMFISKLKYTSFQ